MVMAANYDTRVVEASLVPCAGVEALGGLGGTQPGHTNEVWAYIGDNPRRANLGWMALQTALDRFPYARLTMNEGYADTRCDSCNTQVDAARTSLARYMVATF